MTRLEVQHGEVRQTQAEWYQQAEKAEAHLLKTQDPAAISYKDSEGHTDDIAGVSVHVMHSSNLLQGSCSRPVGRGPYAMVLTLPSMRPIPPRLEGNILPDVLNGTH
jgi:hypothetical protein